IGVPENCTYSLAFNSDEPQFGGDGQEVPKEYKAVKEPMHGKDFSISLTIPPMSVLYLLPNVPEKTTKPVFKKQNAEKAVNAKTEVTQSTSKVTAQPQAKPVAKPVAKPAAKPLHVKNSKKKK
ncbi:MAG: alpha amylase C-terminal domain-containing protein, partial [Oscillospiraceae bacterium]